MAASIAPGKKRETRRRVNARRWLYTGAGDTEELKLRVEARLEALQESHSAEPADAADDDDAYEDLDEDEKKPAFFSALGSDGFADFFRRALEDEGNLELGGLRRPRGAHFRKRGA